MLGNCATGRPAIGHRADDDCDNRDHHGDDRTIDKELGHGSVPCLPGGHGSGIDRHTIPDFLHALNYNPLPWLETLIHDPHWTGPFSDRHVSQRNFVIIPDHSHLVTSLKLYHRFLRYQQCTLPRIADEPDTTKLPGRKTLVGFGNRPASRIDPVCIST